jgi:prophage regulatory protein
MTEQRHSTIWRRKRVLAENGGSRSNLYLQMAQGLWPKPVRLGRRAVGWPACEVNAVNNARIAGRSEDEIRALVRRLTEARKTHQRTGTRGCPKP